MTSSKDERFSATFDEYLSLGVDLASLRGIKSARAAEFIADKTVEAGARLIAANVELSKANNYRVHISRSLAKFALDH